jgi:hypothetical protein
MQLETSGVDWLLLLNPSGIPRLEGALDRYAAGKWCPCSPAAVQRSDVLRLRYQRSAGTFIVQDEPLRAGGSIHFHYARIYTD